MFTTMGIRNFRAVAGIPSTNGTTRPLEIPLKPLTLFIGENNSGKSSLLYPLVLMHYWGGQNPSRISFSNMKFLNEILGQYPSYVYRKEKNEITFMIETNLSPDELNTILSETMKFSEEQYKTLFTEGGNLLQYWLRFSNPERPPRHQSFTDHSGKPLLSLERIPPNEKEKWWPNIENQKPSFTDEWAVWPSLGSDIRNIGGVSDQSTFINLFQSLITLFHNRLNQLYYISELRYNISPQKQIQASSRDVGIHGENVLDVMFFLRNSHIKSDRDSLNNIIKWADEFGLIDALAHIGQVQDGKLSTFGQGIDPTFNIGMDFSSTGFGFQQVLPIIVQCNSSLPGGTVLIEEPEIHLHPRYQMKVMDLFADAVNRNRQIIATTHSEHTFIRLQTLIANGILTPEQVGVYWVNKDQGGTHIKPVQIDSDGGIPGWLPTFGDVINKEMIATDNARNRNGKG